MKIPKELLGKMNADDKAELEGLTASEEAVYQEMEQYFNESLGRFKASQIIMGKVIAISKGLATVDVGFKSEGIVSLSEFPENGKNLQIDDEIEVYLEKVEDNDGNVVLSKEKANKIIVMDEGQIVEEGTHQELLKKPNGYYKNLYEVQFMKEEVA